MIIHCLNIMTSISTGKSKMFVGDIANVVSVCVCGGVGEKEEKE